MENKRMDTQEEYEELKKKYPKYLITFTDGVIHVFRGFPKVKSASSSAYLSKNISNDNNLVINNRTNSLYDEYGFNSKGFNKDGIHFITGTKYDLDGYDYYGKKIEDIIDSSERQENKNESNTSQSIYNKYGFDKNGELDPVIVLALEFIEYGQSISEFCKLTGYKETAVSKALDEALKYESISDDLSNLFAEINKNKVDVREKLLNNEINLSTLRSFYHTLKLMSESDRIVASQNIYNYLIDNDLSGKDYLSYVASASNDLNSGYYWNRIGLCSAMLKRFFERIPNANQSKVSEIISKVDAYRYSYKPIKNEKVEYVNDGKMMSVSVTPRMRKLAKRYIIADNDYVCADSMASTLSKIASGKITEEDVINLENKKMKVVNKKKISKLDFLEIKKLLAKDLFEYYSKYQKKDEEVKEERGRK